MWIKDFNRGSVKEVAGKCLSTGIKYSVLQSSLHQCVLRKKKKHLNPDFESQKQLIMESAE